MRLQCEHMFDIIYVALPYTVGGWPPSESYSSVYIEILYGNLSRRFVLMLTISDLIAVLALCATFYSLGYMHGKHDSKTQK